MKRSGALMAASRDFDRTMMFSTWGGITCSAGDRVHFPDFADIVLQADVFVEGGVRGDQPDAAALIQRDPADAGAAPVTCFGDDEDFHGLDSP